MLVCDSEQRAGLSCVCVSPSLMCCHKEACVLSLAESWPVKGSGITWPPKMKSVSLTITILIGWTLWMQFNNFFLTFCTNSLHVAWWFLNFIPCIAFPLPFHCVACDFSFLLLHPQPHNQQRKAWVHFLSDWWERLITMSHPYVATFITLHSFSGGLNFLARVWQMVMSCVNYRNTIVFLGPEDLKNCIKYIWCNLASAKLPDVLEQDIRFLLPNTICDLEENSFLINKI